MGANTESMKKGDLTSRKLQNPVTPCRSELARERDVQRQFGRIREQARSYRELNRGFRSDTNYMPKIYVKS